MKLNFRGSLCAGICLLASQTFLSACGNTVDDSPLVDATVFVQSDSILHPQDYGHVDPQNAIPADALKKALAYFDANKDHIPNQQYLAVIDYSKHSGQRRFHVMNLKTGEVESLFTAHGKGSDTDNDGIAEKFSNTDSSHMSSLGFMLSGNTYYGGHGLSLTLDGLSSTNSNVRDSLIVIHGASYVSEDRSKMGRSFGCPALDMDLYKRIIGQLKGGALIYAWRG